ncbi:Cx9C motif-containing protein 4, mitochondrial [Ceratocystis fimbriata CBS 114723]|uniref:Cx9C motif-containing protein 4, mitochondrial n=1 Tax=Ceratocystis fimbriata CBS 114723 TaxID=1035309 RepID=A0A2C5X5M8_9PEZI|nr:Cx9C motif-containing protein 4, mitochondrial [Ceratocystis fimbriata CBS 114723]
MQTTGCCLNKNNFNETKCTMAIVALYECCHAFYEQQGVKASSLSCPQPDILRRRLTAMRNGEQR